jgi:hypothetical protein
MHECACACACVCTFAASPRRHPPRPCTLVSVREAGLEYLDSVGVEPVVNAFAELPCVPSQSELVPVDELHGQRLGAARRAPLMSRSTAAAAAPPAAHSLQPNTQ